MLHLRPGTFNLPEGSSFYPLEIRPDKSKYFTNHLNFFKPFRESSPYQPSFKYILKGFKGKKLQNLRHFFRVLSCKKFGDLS
jgi:hypothetical protein